MSDSNKDLKITKGILSNTRSEKRLLTLSRNMDFCRSFMKSTNISTTVSNEDIDPNNTLIYNVPKSSGFDYEAIQAIIDLLMQLRAAQSDQNVFVQSNTVVRQQILRRLKNELTKVQGGLTQNQIQKLQVVSSNTFDEDTLNDLLNSLLEDSKKKLDKSKSEKPSSRFSASGVGSALINNLNEKYTKLVNLVKNNEQITSEVLNNIYRKENISKDVYSKIPDFEYATKHEPLKEDAPKEIKNKEIVENQSGKTNLLQEENISYQRNIFNKYHLIPKIHRSQTDILVSDLSERYKNIAADVFESIYSKYRLFEKPDIEYSVKENIIKGAPRRSAGGEKVLKSEQKDILSYENKKTLTKKQILSLTRLISQVDKISSRISTLNLSQEFKDTVLDIWQNAYSKYINSFEKSKTVNQDVFSENEYENLSKENIVYSKTAISYDEVKEQVYKEIENFYAQNNIVSRESKTLKNILFKVLQKRELSDLYSEIINKKIGSTRTNVINESEEKITNTKKDNILINKKKFLRKNIDIAEVTNKDSFIYKTIESSIRKILKNNVRENISEIFKDENYKKVFTDIIKNVRKEQILKLNQLEKEKKVKEKKETKTVSDTTVKEKKYISQVEEKTYDSNIFKISEAIKRIGKSERLNVKENITNLRRNILANRINKELTVNLLNKQEYKNLEYDRYTVVDKHYLQTQKLNEKQEEFGIKSVYKDKETEKTVRKKRRVDLGQEPKKVTRLDRQIDLVAKIINKSLVSEILSNKEYINIDNIKSDVAKNYKIQVDKIKKKTLETNFERLYQEQLNKVERINRKFTQTDKLVSKINKIKSTVDTIYKVSNKSKILEFLTKNRNIKAQDIKNLISNRHYFDTTREYEENIRADIRDVFQEEISRTNRIYRTDTNYSVNQRIIKDNLRQVNKAVDKSKNIQASVRTLTKENLNIGSKINNKINKYNLLLSNVSRKDEFGREYNSVNLISKNVEKRNISSEQILDIKKDVQSTAVDKITENIQKNILNALKITSRSDISKNVISKIFSLRENETENFVNDFYLNLINERKIGSNRLKNISLIQNEDLINKITKNDFRIYDETRRTYRDNVVNTQIQDENKVLKKEAVLADNKIIKERIKSVSENVINKLINTSMITHKKFKASKDTVNVENIYESRRDVPLTVKENINQTYSIENFIPRKRLNLLPTKSFVDKKVTTEQKDIYRDVVQSVRSYYNDEIEDIGKEHLIRERNILRDESFHRNVMKEDMVYKSPVNLDKIESKFSNREKEKKKEKFHSDITTKKISREEYEAKTNLYRPIQKKAQKDEKTLSKNDIISIIKSYIGDINVDNISRNVMRRVEDKMELDRKRRGIF